MQAFLASEVASKQNKWQVRNTTRWLNPEYDRLYAQSEVRIDPVKRATMLIALNDMVIKNALAHERRVQQLVHRAKQVILGHMILDAKPVE